MIWEQTLERYGSELATNIQQYMFVRAIESKMLFRGNIDQLEFDNTDEEEIERSCSKLNSYSELWTKLAVKSYFESDKLVLFKDFSLSYLYSIKRFY